MGGAPAGVLRPVRLCAGELFRHCGHQGVCEGAQGADCLPPAQQGERGGQRRLHQDCNTARGAGHAVRRVGHLRDFGLRRLARLARAVQRRSACGVHRLL